MDTSIDDLQKKLIALQTVLDTFNAEKKKINNANVRSAISSVNSNIDSLIMSADRLTILLNDPTEQDRDHDREQALWEETVEGFLPYMMIFMMMRS